MVIVQCLNTCFLLRWFWLKSTFQWLLHLAQVLDRSKYFLRHPNNRGGFFPFHWGHLLRLLSKEWCRQSGFYIRRNKWSIHHRFFWYQKDHIQYQRLIIGFLLVYWQLWHLRLWQFWRCLFFWFFWYMRHYPSIRNVGLNLRHLFQWWQYLVSILKCHCTSWQFIESLDRELHTWHFLF